MRVLIAGGGIAALEAAAALHTMASPRVSVCLIAPDDRLVPRQLAPLAPFGVATPPWLPLTALADRLDADLIRDRVTWVDRTDQVAHCASGFAMPFDALVLAPGARSRAPYPEALTLDDAAGPEIDRFTADIVAGAVARVAFVAPERMAWPLPLYEVALMTAALAAQRHVPLALTIVTAEAAPLAAFGEAAGAELLALARERGIEVVTRTRCQVCAPDRIRLVDERGRGAGELRVDRVVSLPELIGPHIRGLPTASYGFIPMDRFCGVRETTRIYAAGDATDYPVKHGGIAAQQADVAARAVAAAAGAPVRPRPFHPVLEGILLTGARPRYLTARLTAGHPFDSAVGSGPGAGEDRRAKVAAPHLRDLLSDVRH